MTTIKTIFKLLLSAATLLAVCSCADEEEYSFLSLADTKDITLSPAEGNSFIELSSSHKWTISSADAWCTVSHANRSNSAGNDILVTLYVSENTEPAERKTTLTVTSETGEAARVAVIQKGQADRYVITSKDSLAFSSKGGDNTMIVSASHKWTASSNNTWCTVSHANRSNSAGNDILVAFKVDENTGFTERRTIVTIALEETGEAVQIAVIQGNNWIGFTPPSAEKFIAHAGGAINGYTYTNSLEALNLSYSKGCKLFELDIIETSDGKLAAAHDWAHYKWIVDYPNSTDEPMSEEEFMSYKIYNQLSPLSEQAIEDWFEEHKDAILVTDKINSPQKIAQSFPSFKDRIIMELFSWDAVEEAISVDIIPMPSENLVFGTSGIEKKLLDMHIEFIAISRWHIDGNKGFLKRLKEQGLKTYVFHVNYESGKDEQWVLENEMDYCYGLYADNLDLLQP
jgi:glycerophosphoryl diester phosphodiesterase